MLRFTNINFRTVTGLCALVTGLLAAGCTDRATPAAAAQAPVTSQTRQTSERLRRLSVPAASGSALPHLAARADGAPALSWVEPAGDGVALRFATLSNNGWGAPVTVATGDDWFINWADYPSVEPINETIWAAHWLQKKPGGKYAYDVVMAVSSDQGEHWSSPLTPHTDNTATEHGFVSLFPMPAGVGALWLDGRNTTGGGHAGHAAHRGGMTLRSATITPELDQVDETLVDDLMCDCCQTDVAVTGRGPVAVYRDRSDTEVRDIAIARSVNGQWQPGVPVAVDNWQIDGCPVNGPAVAAHDQYVVVAWFTGAGQLPRVRLALSFDFGATFATTVTLADEQPLGRVDVVALPNGGAIVSWLSKRNGRVSQLMAQSFDARGNGHGTQMIATTAATRATGFPQMLLANDRLVFAWTDARETPTSLRTSTLPVAIFDEL